MRRIIFIFLLFSTALFSKHSFAQPARYRLPEIVFQPATFQGSVSQPARRDLSLFQQSIDRIEQRANEANIHYSQLMIKLGEYGNMLNNDEATLIWFSEYKKDIRNTFNVLTGLGKWDTARDYVIRKQGDIATDPELQARIRTAKEYHAKLKSIQNNNDMTTEEKADWMRNHPYCFIPFVNGDNRIIGGKLGTKEELNAYKAEEERKKRLLEEQERQRLYEMAHPFDNFDYSKYDKIIDYPQYGFKNAKYRDENITITRIALSSSETRVEFEKCNTIYDCNVQRRTYIKASGTSKLFFLKAENIAIAPHRNEYKKRGEVLKFSLTFPALPKGTKKFTLREEDRNGWRFNDIIIL